MDWSQVETWMSGHLKTHKMLPSAYTVGQCCLIPTACISISYSRFGQCAPCCRCCYLPTGNIVVVLVVVVFDDCDGDLGTPTRGQGGCVSTERIKKVGCMDLTCQIRFCLAMNFLSKIEFDAEGHTFVGMSSHPASTAPHNQIMEGGLSFG